MSGLPVSTNTPEAFSDNDYQDALGDDGGLNCIADRVMR